MNLSLWPLVGGLVGLALFGLMYFMSSMVYKIDKRWGYPIGGIVLAIVLGGFVGIIIMVQLKLQGS